MSFWTELRVPAQIEAVVAVIETHWLSQHAEAGTLAEVMAVMSGFFALTGGIIAQAGGRQIKTLGDNCLAVFPIDRADAAVMALHALKRQGDDWFAARDYRSRVGIKIDAGPVVLGPIGTPGQEILDVFGRPVATAFTMPGTGMTATATVFRLLDAETRKLFKKHTPPVRYIGIDDRRPRGMDD